MTTGFALFLGFLEKEHRYVGSDPRAVQEAVKCEDCRAKGGRGRGSGRSRFKKLTGP